MDELLAWQVLTKDSVTVSVDAVVYYRVSNATVSVANVENAHHSTRLLAQTTLRNVLGTKNLSEILSEREAISNMMQVRRTLLSAADGRTFYNYLLALLPRAYGARSHRGPTALDPLRLLAASSDFPIRADAPTALEPLRLPIRVR